jgi:hypothetical protein
MADLTGNGGTRHVSRRKRGSLAALVAMLVVVAGGAVGVSAASAAVVTVTLEGSANGSVTSYPPGIDCSNIPGAEASDCSFDFGSDAYSGLKLSAVGAGGAAFRDWAGTVGGTCSGTTNPCMSASLGATGAFADVVATFAPKPDKPSASTGAVSDIAFPSAVFSGTVNPNSAEFSLSDCYFEYGTSTAYGFKTPCRPNPVGLGTDPVSVTGSAGMLAPATTYHYRLVASNAGGKSVGGNRTFTSAVAPADSCPNAAIRAQQGPIAQRLPDCYAYELVSPESTAGQEPNSAAIGGTGEDVVLTSGGGFADLENLAPLGAVYRARRTENGWVTESLGGPPTAEYPGYYTDVDWQSDWWQHDRPLSLWTAQPNTEFGTSNKTLVMGYKHGQWDRVTPILGVNAARVATSADLSSVLVGSLQDAKLALTDGTTDTRTSGETFAVVKRLPDGTFDVRQVARTSGGVTLHPSCGLALGGGPGSAMRGAVNRDGVSRVVFTTGGAGACATAARRRVYVAEPFSSSPDVVDISASRCTLGAPACGNAATVKFVGGSSDASRLFMTTTQRLLDEDVHAGTDLYEYDFRREPEDRLQLVSSSPTPAQVQGVVVVSDSGSHIYFIANGVLDHAEEDPGEPQEGAPNLYVRVLGAVGEPARTRFVGTLDANDSKLWAFLAFAESELTPDGRFLAFKSVAQLTATDQDAMDDVYRYDAEEGDLRRAWPEDPAVNGPNRTAASVMAPGIRLTGLDANFANSASSKVASIAEDGSAIGFTSSEAVAPGDVNGKDDAFVWNAETGSVAMISDGKDARGVAHAGMSADGKTQLFKTLSRIIPEHTATSVGLYAVRQGGGFAVPEPPAAPCAGEACQGPPSGSSSRAGVGSTTFKGGGNVVSPAGIAKVRVAKVGTVRGTSARIRVKVAGKGKIRTSGSGLRRASKAASKAGTYRVTVKLSKRAQRTLERTHRMKVWVTVRFTPPNGKTQLARVPVTFEAKATKHRKSSSRAARQESVLSADGRKGR